MHNMKAFTFVESTHTRLLISTSFLPFPFLDRNLSPPTFPGVQMISTSLLNNFHQPPKMMILNNQQTTWRFEWKKRRETRSDILYCDRWRVLTWSMMLSWQVRQSCVLTVLYYDIVIYSNSTVLMTCRCVLTLFLTLHLSAIQNTITGLLIIIIL